MKLQIFTIILIFTLFVGCHNEKKDTLPTNNNYTFFVGTYTNGESQGIYKYSLQNDGILQKIGLATISDNPSFLAKSSDNKYLIAVNEINSENGLGTVESFLIKGDSLKSISKSSTGGAHPCFVAVNESGFVLTANYTSGNIGFLKINSEGELTSLLDVQQHTGKGTTERQEGPHAHSVWFDPDGKNIISVDLGTNELWFSHLDSLQQKLIPSNPNKLSMTTGAGPRHLVFHPNKKWIYVVNELNGSITLVQKTETGKYNIKGSFSTLPSDYTKPNTCADIHISKDGKFVYASNRGHNSIAVFEVNTMDGSLILIGHESTRGDGPRNFSLSPDDKFLLVANQLTNNIISYKRNKTTGLLEFKHKIKAPTPVCILF